MATNRLALGALVLALTAAAVAVRLQSYSLKRTAKEGEVFTYRVTMDVAAGDVEFKMTSTSELKIVRVEPDGAFTSQSVQKGTKIKYKGIADDIIVPDSDITTATRRANGELVTLNADKVDGSSYRMDALYAFHSPENAVKVGDKWSYESKADPKTGAVAGKADFEFVSVDKVGLWEAAKVNWTYTETEGTDRASSEGSVWIDLKDGNLIKCEGKLKAAPLRDAPKPIDFSFKVERIS